MAQFKAHLTMATVAGGLGALSLFVAGQIDTQDTLICLTAAIIGGLLPDIDADNSTPLHIAFTFFATLFSFFVMFSQGEHFSVLELVAVWLLAFLFFKLVVFELFIRATVHRGVFHSLPAGVLFSFLTAIFFYWLFGFSAKEAWLPGIFLFFGFFVHLLLDEIYSLNFLDSGGVKHSFGSAMKLYSSNFIATGILYAVTIALYFATPSLEDVGDDIFNLNTLENIAARFMPSGNWFGIDI